MIMIICFSGTGNSMHAAKVVASIIDDEIVSMNELIRKKNREPIRTDRPLVFVSPVYAWDLPRIVQDFIMKTNFKGNKDAYFILTCDSEPGSSERYIKKLCVQKGFTYRGMASVCMPENLLTMFDIDDEQTCKKKIAAADKMVKGLAEAILDGCILSDDKPRNIFKSAVVNPLFYRFCVKPQKFRTTDKCTSCGKCTENCPLNNIKMVSGRPVWGKECTLCMSCIARCPVEAIEYGKKTEGRRRYHLEDRDL
jgi:NAD-dependent dihydropyrimidine dehydrogenase PreA subunit/flavodoxin